MSPKDVLRNLKSDGVVLRRMNVRITIGGPI
jgi:hypothetical protein